MSELFNRCLRPDWPAPATVKAVTTSRFGGVSQAPFDSLNVGDHCGDKPVDVAQNRLRLREQLKLPSEPHWLKQVHGTVAIDPTQTRERCADACFTSRPHTVLAIMTADCLPVLLCNRAGSWVAAAHAGWRGLSDGVLEQTVACYQRDNDELMAWFGPAIGPDAFEVGDEVRAAFVAQNSQSQSAFKPLSSGKWLADIYLLAAQRLRAQGVTAIYGGGLCTVAAPERFFSYRRDTTTGRMASLIWME